MEAATPLRQPRVTVLANAVVAEGLTVRDRTTVDLVREREAAGSDPAEVLVDAIEIGARVLSREQAEVNADFVRTEFEKVSREVEGAFGEKARVVAEFLGKRVDDVFAPGSGQLARELERLFGAESSVAVQHQLATVMAEASARMREDLLKQFSSADAHNPLADFKAGTVAVLKRAAEQQDANLRALNEQIAGLQSEVVKLQAERAKVDEVAAEHARSTAKGRPYEEAVLEAIDEIATARGDACDGVGRPAGRRRPARRRAGRRGRLRGPGAGPHRLRGQERADVQEPGAGRAGRGDGPAGRRLRRVGGRRRGPPARPRAAAARGQRGQAVRGLRPGGRLAARARGRVRPRPGARADGQGGRRRAGRGRAAHGGRAGAGRDWRTSGASRPSSPRRRAASSRRAALLDAMAERVRAHLGQIDALVATAPGGEPSPQQRLV